MANKLKDLQAENKRLREYIRQLTEQLKENNIEPRVLPNRTKDTLVLERRMMVIDGVERKCELRLQQGKYSYWYYQYIDITGRTRWRSLGKNITKASLDSPLKMC